MRICAKHVNQLTATERKRKLPNRNFQTSLAHSESHRNTDIRCNKQGSLYAIVCHTVGRVPLQGGREGGQSCEDLKNYVKCSYIYTQRVYQIWRSTSAAAAAAAVGFAVINFLKRTDHSYCLHHKYCELTTAACGKCSEMIKTYML
jgi:hypothetical protein